MQVMKENISELKQRPDNGCYIWGLFLEGAHWDMEKFELSESKLKELYTDMPVMWLIPRSSQRLECTCALCIKLSLKQVTMMWFIGQPQRECIQCTDKGGFGDSW